MKFNVLHEPVARAYQELFESSGESPRAVLFDDKRFRALEESMAVLTVEECAATLALSARPLSAANHFNGFLPPKQHCQF